MKVENFSPKYGISLERPGKNIARAIVINDAIIIWKQPMEILYGPNGDIQNVAKRDVAITEININDNVIKFF